MLSRNARLIWRHSIKFSRLSLTITFQNFRVQMKLMGLMCAFALILSSQAAQACSSLSELETKPVIVTPEGAFADSESAPLAEVCDVKTIHFVRHGLALHNIASRGCDDENVFDPALVSFGVTQAEDLGAELAKATGTRVDVIISSPLQRTLQTAAYLRNALNAQARLVGGPAIDVVVFEDAREHFTGCTDAMRKDTSVAKSAFPDFIFNSSLHERDPFRFPDAGGNAQYEKNEALRARAARFFRALGDRPEAHVVAVSHVGIIWRTIDEALKQGWIRVVPPALPARIVYDQGPHFSNCQVASYELRACAM
jgi:broad specificity phosphatase PhoE